MDGPDRKRRSIDTQIDDNLRKIFEEDVEQDLPDRLQRLLEALDGATSDSDDEDSGGSSGGGGSAGGTGSGGAPEAGGTGSDSRADARQVAMTRRSRMPQFAAPLRAAQAGPG